MPRRGERDRFPGMATRAVHAGDPEPEVGAPVVAPIFQTSTFFNEVEPDGEVLYTRYGNNPGQVGLGRKLAALEGADGAVVVGSGMAAMSLTLLSFLGSGDHVVASRELYGGTHRLLTRDLAPLGIQTTFVPHGGRWTAALRKRTRVLLFEVPSNPTLRVVDIAPVARFARERGVAVIVDATFATPVNFRPLEHGADVVVHSATKYLGGHSDLTAGVVAGQEGVVDEVREKLKSFGPALDPHAGFLLERGLKTLPLRMGRHNENALELARWLQGQGDVQTVIHPGLEDHPDHAVATRLFDGYGGVVSFTVKGGDRRATALLEQLRLIRVAPSLGGVESLVSMPRYTSHAALTVEQRAELGIGAGFIRLSVGIEDQEDLRADLIEALRASAR